MGTTHGATSLLYEAGTLEQKKKLFRNALSILIKIMSQDIRRMSKEEIDELNRAGRAWRERQKPAQGAPVAIAEQSQIEDSRETHTPPVTVGDQLELL